MMTRSVLYFDAGDDLEADLVNAFLPPGGVAEIVPRPEPAKGELGLRRLWRNLLSRACRVTEVGDLGQRFQPKEHQVLVLG
jgi:hypothetical protein